MKFLWRLLVIYIVSQGVAFADMAHKVRGFSLTEIDKALYDAALEGQPKTDAQKIVDRLYSVGVRHINLTPRALMTDPRGSAVVPMTPVGERTNERRRYDRLIKYIHGKGMTVGLRPIFFVQKADGTFPYIETLQDGTKKLWWHGNIQPKDTRAWFESWTTFIDSYVEIAKATKAEEFTIGSELYSMTVGIEDQWAENPYGFPGNWVDLLRKVRTKLGTNVRIMYDINFTDDRVDTPNASEYGGEFARWRYRLVDLANPSDQAQAVVWKNLVTFWKELDAIGIDMYRSLATPDQAIPQTQAELVAMLKGAADQYTSQLDNAFYQIESVVEMQKPVIFKEIGFKSIEKGFVRPFEYTDPNAKVNLWHQAAAYDAVFQSFWAAGLDWFGGFVFWDASVDPGLHGDKDKGFSPLGKAPAESILTQYFKD